MLKYILSINFVVGTAGVICNMVGKSHYTAITRAPPFIAGRT
jgi:hypothetical protein